MRTRAAVLCDQVIEAGWLVALIVVPLFFNVYSSRVFEPDKLALLRSIATLMAVAWIIKAIEEGLPEGARWRGGGWRQGLVAAFTTPLVGPTLILAGVYLLATAFSVVPRVSLWGSYQRLQGTYSTLSYMVIALLMMATMRRGEQLRRLVTVVILTSLPIALYGVAQHYRLDPLPWGGDVTSRVAANMGNAIFIAAYLIMVVPLTLARIIELQAAILTGPGKGEGRRLGLTRRIGLGLLFWVAVGVQFLAWAVLGMERGLAVGLLIIVGLTLVAGYLRRPMARFVLLGAYALILCAQLATILFSQSRGPWLGLVAGLFFFGLVYLFSRRWRAAAVAFVGLAAALVAFLVVINLPGTPLSAVREMPYVGRLGQVFETETGTGKVRVLIWEGAIDMIRADPLRTIIGYGPEAMYVAYNPFYPPDLAHYESRSASPDRSHNETFDALVMTGLVGFIAYMLLFGSVFYYGLRWLGLIHGRGQSRLFLALGAAGAVLGVVVPLAVEGTLRFAGVGLPLGFVAGVALYMATSAIMAMMARRGAALGREVPPEEPESTTRREPRLSGPDLLLMVALLAAVVAHFVEIHFGIAIAATRTYFWCYIALMALVGRRLLSVDATAPATAEEVGVVASATVAGRTGVARRGGRRRDRRRRGERSAATSRSPEEGLPRGLLVMGLAVGLILATVAWDYTTNPLGQGNPLAVLVTALTTMAAKGLPNQWSLGILWLGLGTALVATLVAVAEAVRDDEAERDAAWWARSLGAFAGIALGSSGLYALIHAARLAPGVNTDTLIYEYAMMMLAFWGALALAMYRGEARPQQASRGAWAYAYPILIVAALLFANAANLRIVRADVLYKHGLKFDEQGDWDSAIHYYRRAIDLTPREDFYYLFHGRALLERGKGEADPARRQALFEESLASLNAARALNPLNTDHTANLARLHRTWAEFSADAAARQEHLRQALAFYQAATELSPHNAQLYNEWGLVHFLLGDLDAALATYDRSLGLDREFPQTYILRSDVHIAREHWPAVIDECRRAVEVEPDLVQGWSAMGYAYSKMDDWENAIAANLKVHALAPADYNTLKNLAILYDRAAQPTQAVAYAEMAIEAAPEGERSTMEAFLQDLRERNGEVES